jgi:hypothetical protein
LLAPLQSSFLGLLSSVTGVGVIRARAGSDLAFVGSANLADLGVRSNVEHIVGDPVRRFALVSVDSWTVAARRNVRRAQAPMLRVLA